MSIISTKYPTWLTEWMEAQSITLWGAADLRDFSTPLDKEGEEFPFAIGWAIPMNHQIMASIQNGPNQPYATEYARVNNHINELSVTLSAEIGIRGFKSKPLAASDRSDTINIKGDFPHKTVATRAGLGWVGRHCQLITRPFGSWVRLGTVFTDLELPFGSTNREELLWKMYELCRGLSCKGTVRQRMASWIATRRDIGCAGM